MPELKAGEAELETYFRRRGWPFERHPLLTEEASAPRPDYLVQNPRTTFVCEVKDIESWRIVEALAVMPNEASYVDPTLAYHRQWSKIRSAHDKQLARYASIHPVVVALAEAAASDVVLDSHSMCELLIGRDEVVISRQTGEIIRHQATVTDHPNSLFYAPRTRPADAFDYLTGGLAAVVVVRSGASGVDVYLNPNCEALTLQAEAFDHADDRVWGLTPDGFGYQPVP